MKKIQRIERRLKDKMQRASKKKDYELLCQLLGAYCLIEYKLNQRYFIQEVEDYVAQMAADKGEPQRWVGQEDTVLFYDGFGTDTRGLALMYVKALAQTGKKVVYVTDKKASGAQPNMDALVEKEGILRVRLREAGCYARSDELEAVFAQYKPSAAFFYAFPEDIPAAIAFARVKGLATRYQINLTDHSYWAGRDCLDYCIEFRNYGSCISYEYRGIPKDKIILLPYYPLINDSVQFAGFPFEKKQGQKVLFSGGSIYKTFGEGNLYYTVVEDILKNNENLIFLYAGVGDNSLLMQLAEKFPARVYHIPERKDLYQLMCNVDVYLNTYPMIGGLMTQYAAISEKPPYMLKHDHDGDGILIDQKNRGIEFDDPDELVEDITRFLTDEDYAREKVALLQGSVNSEQTFTEELRRVLTEHTTKFAVELEHIDTKAFRDTYLETLNERLLIEEVIGKTYYKRLTVHFPLIFLRKAIRKAFERVFK